MEKILNCVQCTWICRWRHSEDCNESCDTISRIYGVGRKKVFQKLLKGDPILQSCARAFTTPNHTTQLIDDT
ncbi:hypothetical protein PR048_012571 [Dryococelus australis]|uniref:Uncharacterized protein n=1 Tax=Dryococelus australis TaxID=614101 RepID=A0ABQ9HQD3_9NEOP|nr:hypothetical protein PR048_012571 [Dryococelus australis]